MARVIEEGEARVIDVRLTALSDVIRRRDWEQVEFQFDRVRSTVDRALGNRTRETDLLRKDH